MSNNWWDLAPRRTRPPGEMFLWPGVVTAIVAGRPKVKIPKLSGKELEYGPCLVLETPRTVGLFPVVTGSTSTHTHTIAEPAPLAIDDEVVVGFLCGDRRQPIVYGRLL